MVAGKLPAVGKKIRDQSVELTGGQKAKLSELAGKRGMILYFYPRDMTSGCTTEACDFRDNMRRLGGLGYGVVGVSADTAASHQKFTAKEKLNFPLIADAGGKLARSLGAWGEKKLYGRVSEGIIRTTFVLDADLKVERVYPKVRATGHVAALLADLKGS